MITLKHDYLEGIPEVLSSSFGQLTKNFVMIVWGHSANGKSSFVLQIARYLLNYGSVLYLSLEEGYGASIQANVKKYFDGVDKGLAFADHTMTYDELVSTLSKKRSAKFVVIDSLQYWGITYPDYKKLKQKFKNKTFIFISHASGKLPDGKTADKIRYDACVKVRVEGYVAFVASRYGGNKPFVIWEDGAKKYYGKKFKKVVG